MESSPSLFSISRRPNVGSKQNVGTRGTKESFMLAEDTSLAGQHACPCDEAHDVFGRKTSHMLALEGNTSKLLRRKPVNGSVSPPDLNQAVKYASS